MFMPFFFLNCQIPLSRRHNQQLSTRLYKTRIRLKWTRILVASIFPWNLYLSLLLRERKKKKNIFWKQIPEIQPKISKEKAKTFKIYQSTINICYIASKRQWRFLLTSQSHVYTFYLFLFIIMKQAFMTSLDCGSSLNSWFLILPTSPGHHPYQQQSDGS